MKFVVKLATVKRKNCYMDGLRHANTPLEKAFVFDDDAEFVVNSYQGDAFPWANGYRKSLSRQFKKKFIVEVL